MQTFLPYPNFTSSAVALDKKRLWKQCVETKQIYRAIREGSGWANHPAVRQWQSYEKALLLYGIKMVVQAMKCGIKTDMLIWYGDALDQEFEEHGLNVPYPKWLGLDIYHASHRSNLLRKDPEYYGQFGWEEGPDQPYFWPSKEGY